MVITSIKIAASLVISKSLVPLYSLIKYGIEPCEGYSSSCILNLVFRISIWASQKCPSFDQTRVFSTSPEIHLKALAKMDACQEFPLLVYILCYLCLGRKTQPFHSQPFSELAFFRIPGSTEYKGHRFQPFRPSDAYTYTYISGRKG